MITRVFTFGHGQHCPFTGKHLLGFYATVTAPTAAQCVDVMNATFGYAWAADYPSVKAAGGDDFALVEHARIVIPVPVEITACLGARAGFEADCGKPGPHGPHPYT